MQHLHKSGLAELELADWKHSRTFRILSFDHDLFSFTDFSWRKSSVFIHITNPPNWHLTNPEKQVIYSLNIWHCRKLQELQSHNWFLDFLTKSA